MPTDATLLRGLIEAELSRVDDERVVAHVRKLLVEPHVVDRVWDYGSVGQTYPCWTVLDDAQASGTGIAFCEFGFGPRCPWGLVFTGGDQARYGTMGMDSGWYPTLMDAFFDSFASASLPIWRVFSMTAGRADQALTGEMTDEDAWAECHALRQRDTASAYMVHHSVRYGGK